MLVEVFDEIGSNSASGGGGNEDTKIILKLYLKGETCLVNINNTDYECIFELDEGGDPVTRIVNADLAVYIGTIIHDKEIIIDSYIIDNMGDGRYRVRSFPIAQFSPGDCTHQVCTFIDTFTVVEFSA